MHVFLVGIQWTDDGPKTKNPLGFKTIQNKRTEDDKYRTKNHIVLHVFQPVFSELKVVIHRLHYDHHHYEMFESFFSRVACHFW